MEIVEGADGVVEEAEGKPGSLGSWFSCPMHQVLIAPPRFPAVQDLFDFPFLLAIYYIWRWGWGEFLIVESWRNVRGEEGCMEDRGLDPPGGWDLEFVRHCTDLLEDFERTKSSITHFLGGTVNPEVGSFKVDLVADLVVGVVLGFPVMPTFHVLLSFPDGGLRVFVRPFQIVKESLGFKVLGASERGRACVRVSTCFEEEW